MRIIKAFTFIILYTCVNSFAQNGDYFNIKEVKSYRFDHLKLTNDKEAAAFLKNVDEYNFIEALKIGNISNINQVLSSLRKCHSLKELNLIDYLGELNESSFDSCIDIEILHLMLSEEKLERLAFTKDIKNISTLYLYILGKPENTSAIKLLPPLKELHIIGDFLPKDLEEILVHVKEQRMLMTLGLSIDRVTDLPKSITGYKFLSKINLYDNLSVFTNKGIDDLAEEKLSIMFDLMSDLVSAISISYYSNNGSLSDFERDYLQSIYNGDIIPQQFEQMEAVAEDGFNIPFKKEFVPDFPKTAEFNPPYGSIAPAEEIFVINPAINNILYAQSGMKISIAANSFVNEKGETTKDPVYLRLIQIISPTELLFAGLNLRNGSSQFINQFLFNIQATGEKNSAVLKSGYQIKISMPSSVDSSLAHFYDYESNTWQNLAFYNEIFANNFEPIDFHKLEESAATKSTYLFDTTDFDRRFESSHSVFLNDKDNFSQIIFRKKTYYTDLDRTWIKTYNQSGKLKGIRIKKGKAYVKLQKVIPKVRNKNKQYFKILDRTELNMFGELKAFKSINFNVDIDPNNKREFTENFIRNIKYIDIRVTYNKGKDNCEILLKTNDGYRKVTAYITDSEDKEIIKKHLKKFEKAYANYLRILDRRRKEFNTMNQLRFDEFKSFTNDKTKTLQKNNQFSELKIHQLGTFALFYDRKPEFNTGLIAQYTDLKGLPIDIKDIFMIDSRYNTVFRIAVGNLSFEPEFCSYIIATDYSGNLYYANKNDILSSNLSNNSLIYIKLKKVPSNLSGIPAFNNLIKN